MKKNIFCLCAALALVACANEDEPGKGNGTSNGGIENPTNEKQVILVVEKIWIKMVI